MVYTQLMRPHGNELCFATHVLIRVILALRDIHQVRIGRIYQGNG